MEPLKNLGLDPHEATKLATKFDGSSVQHEDTKQIYTLREG